MYEYFLLCVMMTNDQKIPYTCIIQALYEALCEYEFTSNDIYFTISDHQIDDIEAYLYSRDYCIPLSPQVKDILDEYAQQDSQYKFLGQRKTHAIIKVSKFDKDTITLTLNLMNGFRNKISETNGQVLISPFSH